MPLPSSTLMTAAGVALTVIFSGIVYKNSDPGEKVVNQVDMQHAKADIQDVKELIQSLKEIQEIKKTQRDEQKERQTSQVQEYKKGEMEAVITSEMLSNIVSSAVEKAMERQNDEIQEKLDRLSNLEEKIIERLDEHKRREEIPKVDYQPSPDNDFGEKLHNIEKLLQERKSDNFNYSYYVDVAMTNISSAISTIKNLSAEVYVHISTKSAQIIKAVSFGYYDDHPFILSAIAFVLSLVLDILVMLCLYRVCSRFHRKKKKPQPIIIGGRQLTHVFTSKPPPYSSDSGLKRSFQKLENSICVVSFSGECVESCHMPLVKSLSDLLTDWNLQTKRVMIQKPADLNTIPPSKIFVVFVDFNEKNEILESDVARKGHLLIRTETVRSLMESFALVILVYCLEASSEKLSFGDRYAHKLHNKVESVDELRLLSDKHCMFSVYTKFNEFQLGSLKQTMQEYLQEIKEIVS